MSQTGVFKPSDVDPGLARMEGLDSVGIPPVNSSMTYGVDGAGADLTIYGDTSGVYLRWDQSADSLLIPGTTGKFQIGGFTGAAIGTGSVVSATATAPFKVFADDGGAAIGSGSLVRAGWFRNLQTYTTGNREQESTGVQGSLVSVAGTNRHNMSGVLGSYEARTSLTVDGQAASTDTWCQAGVLGRVGSAASIITIASNGVLAGVAAMSNVTTGFAANSGVYTAFYAGAWSGNVDWAYGMYLEGGKFTTGIAIGTCTDGITIAACTDGITITGATGYALDIQTSGQVRLGIQGTGIPTATATPFAMEIHAETNADTVLTAGTTGLTAGIRCRYEISKAQTEQISFTGIEGRLRPKAAMADGVHSGVSGTIEADGAVAFTGTATTQRSAGNFCVELGEACTFGSTSGWVTGVTIDSSIHATQTGTGNITFPALRIKKASGKLSWQYGIYMDAGGCTDGIYLSATTKAHEMVVTALPADARGARYAFACATPAMSDGYGAHEIDLTISGTGTGMTSASSTWINVGSGGTIPSSSYAWVHNDGIWLDNSATATGACLVWSRVQFVFGTNTTYSTLHLFDLNLDIDQNMTSLINVNNLALTGYTAGAHSSAVTGSIPFIGTGGSVKYIRVYDTAA